VVADSIRPLERNAGGDHCRKLRHRHLRIPVDPLKGSIVVVQHCQPIVSVSGHAKELEENRREDTEDG
jgi:hypothetical protein